MNHSPAHWAQINPEAVCAGSSAQVRNVLTMALQDIAEMGRALEYVLDHIADKERGPRDIYPAFGLDAGRAIEMMRAALAVDPACMAGVASNKPCLTDGTSWRCTICGFVVDTRYAAKRPAR